jgi:hypothetical protein
VAQPEELLLPLPLLLGEPLLVLVPLCAAEPEALELSPRELEKQTVPEGVGALVRKSAEMDTEVVTLRVMALALALEVLALLPLAVRLAPLTLELAVAVTEREELSQEDWLRLARAEMEAQLTEGCAD